MIGLAQPPEPPTTIGLIVPSPQHAANWSLPIQQAGMRVVTLPLQNRLPVLLVVDAYLVPLDVAVVPAAVVSLLATLNAPTLLATHHVSAAYHIRHHLTNIRVITTHVFARDHLLDLLRITLLASHGGTAVIGTTPAAPTTWENRLARSARRKRALSEAS